MIFWLKGSIQPGLRGHPSLGFPFRGSLSCDKFFATPLTFFDDFNITAHIRFIGGYFASYFAESVSSRLTASHGVSKVHDLAARTDGIDRLATNRVQKHR